MSDKHYQVIFEGQLTGEFQLEQVKSQLAALFKMNAQQVETLFTGKPIAIKRNIDQQTALKYQAALKKAGANCQIQDSQANTETTENNEPTPPNQSTDSNNANTTSNDRTGRSFGKDIVHINVPADVAGLSVAAAGETIETLDKQEVVDIPDVSSLSLAAEDSVLIDAAEEIVEPKVDIAGLSLEQDT